MLSVDETVENPPPKTDGRRFAGTATGWRWPALLAITRFLFNLGEERGIVAFTKPGGQEAVSGCEEQSSRSQYDMYFFDERTYYVRVLFCCCRPTFVLPKPLLSHATHKISTLRKDLTKSSYVKVSHVPRLFIGRCRFRSQVEKEQKFVLFS